jgi:hypothetical protein
MAVLDVEDSPNLLPRGYRIVHHFCLMPRRVAGRKVWLEDVRVIQRYVGPTYREVYDYYWLTVGCWDEVMPGLVKPARYDDAFAD